MRICVLSIVLFASICPLSAQSTGLFRTFDAGGGWNDRGWSLVADQDGYLVATLSACASTSSCMGLGKYDQQGNLLWVKTYEGFRQGGPNCMCRTSDNNYVLTGDVTLPDGDYAIFLMKLNQQGDSLWVRYFNSPATNFARSLNQLPNGDLIIEGDGWPLNSPARPEKTIIKTDAQGQLIWHHDYPDNFQLAQYGNLTVLSTGELLMCYNSWTTSTPRYTLTKLSADGLVRWTKTYFQQLDASPSYARELPDGGYALFGSIDTFIPQTGKVILPCITTDTAGTVLSEKYFYAENVHAYLSNIVPGPGGCWYGAGGILRADLNRYTGWVVKLSPDGDLLWQRYYVWDGRPDNFPFWFEDIRISPEGRIAISGTAADALPSGQQADGNAMLLVLDENGCFAPDAGCDDGIQAVSPVRETPGLSVRVNLSPNPVRDLLRIAAPGADAGVLLSISNIVGQVMYRQYWQPQAEGDLQIPVARWQPGVYFVRLQQAGKTIFAKKVQVIR